MVEIKKDFENKLPKPPLSWHKAFRTLSGYYSEEADIFQSDIYRYPELDLDLKIWSILEDVSTTPKGLYVETNLQLENLDWQGAEMKQIARFIVAQLRQKELGDKIRVETDLEIEGENLTLDMTRVFELKAAFNSAEGGVIFEILPTNLSQAIIIISSSLDEGGMVTL